MSYLVCWQRAFHKKKKKEIYLHLYFFPLIIYFMT